MLTLHFDVNPPFLSAGREAKSGGATPRTSFLGSLIPSRWSRSSTPTAERLPPPPPKVNASTIVWSIFIILTRTLYRIGF